MDALIGKSVEKWGMGEGVSGGNSNSLFPGSWKHAWLSNTQGITSTETSVGGSPWGSGALASFFGRINYDYKEKYYGYSDNESWRSSTCPATAGIFHRVAGWLLTMRTLWRYEDYLDFFKLKGSWRNGNAKFLLFQYLPTVSFEQQNELLWQQKGDLQQGGYADIF